MDPRSSPSSGPPPTAPHRAVRRRPDAVEPPVAHRALPRSSLRELPVATEHLVALQAPLQSSNLRLAVNPAAVINTTATARTDATAAARTVPAASARMDVASTIHCAGIALAGEPVCTAAAVVTPLDLAATALD